MSPAEIDAAEALANACAQSDPDAIRVIVDGAAALIRQLVAAVRERDAELAQLRAKNATTLEEVMALGDAVRCVALETHLAALINSLPKCDSCAKPATRAFVRGGARYCDEHGAKWGTPEYPRAVPLRAAMEAIGAKR